MALLEVKDLNKSYGSRKAVNNVNFAVEEGEVLGLLGPNGAGKSTTISLITGLLKPSKGNVTIGGWDLNKNGMKAKELVGIVPQESAIYEQLTANANLMFWGKMNGLKGNDLKKAVEKVLKITGLEDRSNEKVGKFSGGMKRRLNIASGLVHNPKLIIMDEPTVGVDPQSRNHILETIGQLKSHGTTIIYTSHYVEEVEMLSDRVIIMDQGKIISQGTTEELLNQAGEYQELMITVNNSFGNYLKSIQSLQGVEGLSTSDNKLNILTKNAEKLLPHVFEIMINNELKVSEIKITKPNLESLFLKLTGKSLRD